MATWAAARAAAAGPASCAPRAACLSTHAAADCLRASHKSAYGPRLPWGFRVAAALARGRRNSSSWAARGDPGGEASTAESRDAQAEHTPNALLAALNTPLGARQHVERARGSRAARAEGC